MIYVVHAQRIDDKIRYRVWDVSTRRYRTDPMEESSLRVTLRQYAQEEYERKIKGIDEKYKRKIKDIDEKILRASVLDKAWAAERCDACGKIYRDSAEASLIGWCGICGLGKK